jgi:type II secretory pathway pseudopilin PulG
MQKQGNSQQKSFTLLELLVVLCILICREPIFL